MTEVKNELTESKATVSLSKISQNEMEKMRKMCYIYRKEKRAKDEATPSSDLFLLLAFIVLTDEEEVRKHHTRHTKANASMKLTASRLKGHYKLTSLMKVTCHPCIAYIRK